MLLVYCFTYCVVLSIAIGRDLALVERSPLGWAAERVLVRDIERGGGQKGSNLLGFGSR